MQKSTHLNFYLSAPWPNPRLQRTPAALPPSPLSRKPLGASRYGARTRRGTILCVALSLSIVCPAAAQTVAAKIDAFGVFREVSDSDGRHATLVKQTERVDACLHTLFGYHAVIAGLKAGSKVTFRKVLVHPQMHMPDKTISTGYQKSETVVVRSDGTVGTFQGYGLDDEHERVLGLWTVEFWYGSQKLTTKTFTLVPCGKP